MSHVFTGDPVEVFRLLYCETLTVLVLVRLPADFRFLRARGDARALPLLLGRFPLPRLSFGGSIAGAIAFALLLAAAGAGLAPAATLFLAGGVAMLHFAQLADSPAVHRKANTVPVILLLLAAAALPSATEFATVSAVTRTVIKLLLAQLYFAAGLGKIRESGWRWCDGQTLRRWLAYYHLRDGGRLALALAGSGTLCRVAATLTVAFELTFWLVLVFPALAWIYVAAALAFHAATACLLRIHYWIYLGPAYLVFVAEWAAPRG